MTTMTLPIIAVVLFCLLVDVGGVLFLNWISHGTDEWIEPTATPAADEEENISVGAVDDFAMPAQSPALGFGSPIEAQLLVAADYGRRAPHRMRLRELPIACPGCLAEELRRRARAGQMPPEHYPQYYPVLCALHAETLPSLPAVQVVKEKAN